MLKQEKRKVIPTVRHYCVTKTSFLKSSACVRYVNAEQEKKESLVMTMIWRVPNRKFFILMPWTNSCMWQDYKEWGGTDRFFKTWVIWKSKKKNDEWTNPLTRQASIMKRLSAVFASLISYKNQNENGNDLTISHANGGRKPESFSLHRSKEVLKTSYDTRKNNDPTKNRFENLE